MRLVFGKKQNFLSWEDFFQVSEYQGLQIIRLQEFCCVFVFFLKQNDIKQCDSYKYEICALKGFYALLIGSFLGMFWDNQLVPSLRVKQLTLEVGNGRRMVVLVTVGVT